jgi:DNA replicative helicase MCM subunit Mcm2 (Cdc46/Mcm family)
LNIKTITAEFENNQLAAEDIKQIKLMSEKRDLLKIISQSIAP